MRRLTMRTSSARRFHPGGREKRPSGRPCGLLRSPRAALVMDAITAAHAARRKTRKAVGCAILL